MKNILTFMIILCSWTTMARDSFTLLHYNIKELDSKKLKDGSDQLKAVKEILSKHKFDLLSINEIQYDLPNVPNPSFTTTAENPTTLAKYLDLKDFKDKSIDPANTGLKAKKKENGHYHIDPNAPQARASADQVNFGTMPGQYSSALLSKYEIISKKVFSKILWSDFNAAIDLKEFRTADGSAFPESAELFDKNFSDITVSIDNKEVHIILLHTVAAFNFGNAKSPNYKRNRDQLRFLEWYLTGSTDIPVNLPKIKPLKSTDYFVAVGDWNTAYDSTANPGSLILRRLFKKINMWIPPSKLSFTNEGSSYGAEPFRLMLDYIGTSKNIEVIKGEILHPDFSRTGLGCSKKPENPNVAASQVLVNWREKSKTCWAIVDKSYKLFKDASDHYPIIGTFKLK